MVREERVFTMNDDSNYTGITPGKDTRMVTRPDREVLGGGEGIDYILVPNYLRTCFPQLTYTDKWLYICLLDLYSETKATAYSLRKLEAETGISRASLCRAIPKLRQVGLIRAILYDNWHITVIVPTAEQVREAFATGQLEQIQKYPVEELDKVSAQIRRAMDAGVEASLIVEDWLETLDYFLWQCAYCRGPYEVIEHFIPIALGGGTTYLNCVPACMSCNNRKDSHHPALIPATLGMREAIGRVSAYLECVRKEVEA